MVRHEGEFMPAPPNPDGLEAIADAVREAGRALPSARSGADSDEAPDYRGDQFPPGEVVEESVTPQLEQAKRGGRRHLRSVPAARAE